ncbi:hypothetical protein TNCV_2878092 [Trichonephila clavipes]|uniref:Uncharacterized protein n=1 Tax=Trichonephila clavipes TaxID=2585209 RepID=A0A8X7BCE7_TRICX|nr:hypothetical protein TNCV_2878092 [Trichonephila clavipes]
MATLNMDERLLHKDTFWPNYIPAQPRLKSSLDLKTIALATVYECYPVGHWTRTNTNGSIIDDRHLSNKDSTDQSEMFERTVSGIKKDEPSTKSTSKESTKNRGKLQNELLTRNRGGNDASKNKADSFQSQSNTVGDLETKAGPGPGLNSNLETKNTSNLRHLSNKDSTDQSEMFERTVSGIKKDEPSTKSTSKESTKNRGKLQNELLTRNRGGNDASKNKADSFQSQSNTVGDLETKAGPGPGLNSNLETKNTSNLRHSLSKNCILQNKVLERKINNTSSE